MSNFLENLGSIDRRYIFLIIAIVVLLPLIFPLGLPVEPTNLTIDSFNAIDKIPKDEKVLVSFDYGPSTKPEIHPMAIAVLRHLFTNGNRVIITCLWPDGLFMARQALQQVAIEEFDLTYGIDFVNLGYRPGNEAVIKGITRSFPANFTVDSKAINIKEIPLMDGVQSLKDIGFIFSLSAGYPGSKEWVQYASDPLKIKTSTGVTSIQVNEILPFVKGGQLQGIIAGMPGAAEYEQLLINNDIHPVIGKAGKSMDAQSIAHLVIVLFIVIGNISYFVKRKKEKKY
ncbi:MAG: hypothetical protein PF551_01715 [Candidatus Marinimicrobia bacterium]|jgi:hypothetical protein|nr:hypothetical protein [Candidatus Neomarinimicrobiota bacterium]